jgi:hypothetical protein
MERVVTVAELRSIFPAVNDSISDYAIGFAKFVGSEDAIIAGSGTLVAFRGRHAILTADHVLDVLPDTGSVGLILPTRYGPQLHRAILDMGVKRKITIGRASYDHSGPDLGLVLLAPTDVSRLPSTKVFYSLDKRLDTMRTAPRPIDMGGWFLAGMIGERTSDLDPERGFARVKAFRGFTGAGVVVAEHERAGFDYLEFQAKYDAAYEGPESFGGVSGGGLWQAVFELHNETLSLVEVLLSGVAFFQSAIADDIRTIFCHGRQSVYELVARELEKAL